MSEDHNQAALERLVTEVLASAKYGDICPDLIRHIGTLETGKRKSFKEALKATKNKLHQVSGAYRGRLEQYASWLEEVRRAVREGDKEQLRAVNRHIMHHHASTRERLPILDQFYSSLMADLAPIRSVLDIACGLNPLAIPWMPLEQGARYYAYDIHQQMLDFLKDYMKIIGMEGETRAYDVTLESPQEEVDVALILKTLPCLEQVEKKASLRLLREIRAKILIVSFPVHSLGGRSKGMEEYYEGYFYKLIEKEQKQWKVSRFEFGTELAFVMKKEIL